MPDRVDTELRRVTTALAEVSPPKPDLPRPGRASHRPMPAFVVAIGAFVLVLGAGLIVRFATTSDPSTAELGTGIVAIPDGHVANEVLALEPRAEEVRDLATQIGFFDYSCVSGRAATVCAIWDDGIAVLIPFRIRDGSRVEVRTPSFDGPLEVPLESGEPVGVRHDGGLFSILTYAPGEEVPTSGTGPLPWDSGGD